MREHITVCLTSEDQEYQVLQGEEARQTGRRLGVEVEVLFADDNGVRQIQQLFSRVHAAEDERPAALLVHTRVPDGLERVARNAARTGLGWLLLNRTAPYLEALRREHPHLAIGAVTTDHTEIGGIQARQLMGLCPDGAPVLYVQGPADAPTAKIRLEAFRSSLRGRRHPMKVLNGEWTAASAEKAVSGWLRLRTSDLFAPAAVVCQNDMMARGARKALESQRPEWAHVPFLGCDGLPGSGVKDVDEGRLAGTVVIPSCGGPAVEQAAEWRRGGAVPPLHTVLPPLPYPETGGARSG